MFDANEGGSEVEKIPNGIYQKQKGEERCKCIWWKTNQHEYIHPILVYAKEKRVEMSKRKQEKHVRWDVSLRSFNRRHAEGKWCRTHLFGRRLNVSVSCLLVSRIIVLFLPLSSLKTLIFFTITTDISFTHIQHSLHQFCCLHSSFPSSSFPSFNYLLHRIPFPSFAIEFFPVRFVSGFDIDVCLLSPSLVFFSVLSFTPLLPTEKETCFGEFCYESPSSPGVVSISLRFFSFSSCIFATAWSLCFCWSHS